MRSDKSVRVPLQIRCALIRDSLRAVNFLCAKYLLIVKEKLLAFLKTALITDF